MPAAKRAKAFKLPENITKICAIFLVKKTYFPSVAVSHRCEITYSFISPRAQNGSRLIQARFRASSAGLLTKIRNTAQHRSVQ